MLTFHSVAGGFGTRTAVRRTMFLAVAILLAGAAGFAQAPRLLKVLSGPSGKTVGDRFVLEEQRSRFLVPQDKSLIIYMEFEGSPGNHKISGIWKRPDGTTGFVSSDIEMDSEGTLFNAFWTFYLNPAMQGGVWQFEALVDGVPVGAYPFEVVLPQEAADPLIEAKVTSKEPTLDDLYRLRTSLVWVHRLDEMGHRLDTKSGFVVMEGVVATSFEAIDVADNIEVEFANARREAVSEVIANSAADDWALLKVNTDIVDALLTLDTAAVAVGDRLVAFNAEAQNTRVIGGVDYTGRRSTAKLERFVFEPGLSGQAMGGPLFDRKGNVIGLLSGCVAPGTTMGAGSQPHGSVGSRLCVNNTAIPIAAVAGHFKEAPVSFASLKKRGIVTARVREEPAFLNGGTRLRGDAERQKRIVGRLIVEDKTEFVQADGEVAVYSWWRQPERDKKPAQIAVSTQVFDAENNLRAESAPRTLKFSRKTPTEYVFAFPLAPLQPGIYRIDTLANGVCAWRTFIEVRP